MSTLTEIKELLIKTLYNWTSSKVIPHSKKAGLRFDREEVERWLLSNPIKTVEDIEKEASSYILKNKRQ